MNQEKIIDIIKIFLAACLVAVGYAFDADWSFFVAYVICGYEVIWAGLTGLFKGHALDENFLMLIATSGAIYCKEFPEAAGVMLFYCVGEFFEDYAVDKSRRSIAAAMDIKAQFANKIVGDQVVVIDPEDLEIGDVVLVKPGEKVPIDGIVVSGSSSLDTAALTGESLPYDVSSGDNVISGSVNGSGVLQIRATSDYDDSAVGKILELIEDAAVSKARVEKFITRFAKYYTPIVVALAILLAIVPPLVLSGAVFSQWLYRAMVFLVISCPCALVISVPMTLFAGIGSASSKGILVKGSNYLEALADIEAFAFDKTGTLTNGSFAVTEVVPRGNHSEKELLKAAYYGEAFSEHPIAKAIVNHIKGDVSFSQGEIKSDLDIKYSEKAGFGVHAELSDGKIYCGNHKLMKEIGVELPQIDAVGSVVHVAISRDSQVKANSGQLNNDVEYLGYIVVSDTIRPEAKEMINQLNRLGVKETVMFTGDRKEIALSVAESLGISHVEAELLPQDKVAALSRLKERRFSAFVGDGINDAPVIAGADVGVAMGALGSDAAIEAADIVIMADDISKIPTLIKISRKVMRICKQNVIFALGIKFAVLILGALGFASMWAAVFADVGVAVLAILNAMRAMKI